MAPRNLKEAERRIRILETDSQRWESEERELEGLRRFVAWYLTSREAGR